MGRRNRYTHHQIGVHPEGDFRAGKPLARCGIETFWSERTTEVEAEVTCPACLKPIHQRQLAERSADAVPLALGKYEGRSPYRFTYRAMVGGEAVGFICYDGAYGGGTWRVCGTDLPEGRRGTEVGFQLSVDPSADYPKEFSFPTKEAALMACEGLRAAGRLRTLAEETKRIADFKKRSARIDREMAQETEQGNEDRALALDAIAELLTRDDLSNSQRAGLEAAAKVVRKVDKDEKRRQAWKAEKENAA